MTTTPLLPAEPFTRADLTKLGLTDWGLRTLLSDGTVRRIMHGVYVGANVADSHDLRISAAALAIAPGHVAVDRTAAWLLGVDVFRLAEHTMLPAVEAVALPGHHPTERTGVRGRSRDLAPRDICTVGPLRVTTPLRTALDLGRSLHRRDAYAAMVSLARSYDLTSADLTKEVRRFRGRRGVIQARELATLVDTRLESPRESWVYLEIHDRGLPLPEPQYWIVIDGVPTYRLDFAYPSLRIAVEYDGFESHELTPEQREHDRTRREWLRENGWTVLVVRRGDFTGSSLERWIFELREALRSVRTNRRWRW